MHLKKATGFTLVELIVVMAVILILAGLAIPIASLVHKKSARIRALHEIKQMGAALESYKADNGTYPDDSVTTAGNYTKGSTDNLDARQANDPTTTTAGAQFEYNGPNPNQSPNLALYRALSGDRNLDGSWDAKGTSDSSLDLDGNPLANPPATPSPSYMPFAGMLSFGSNGKVAALVDPFGYPYGYSTAYQGDLASGVNPPVHGYNSTYDLWSTAGNIGLATDTQAQTTQKRLQWIMNTQSQ